MKKLIAMIGAVAAAFGLYADDGVLNQRVTFDPPTYNVGDTISNATADATGVYGWYLPEGASEESGTVAVADDNQYLAIETDAGKPLARTFNQKGDVNVAPTPVDIDKGLFMDTKVKFTLGEEQPTVGDGTKLIIWAKETEADENVEAATNLMVVAGSYDNGVVTATNFTLDVGANFDFSVWHRVTVRAIKDVTASGMVSGFAIFIDQNQVAALDGDYAAKVGTLSLTSEATKFYNANQLFLSCSEAGVSANTKLSYTGFEGAGSIDDLALCDKDGAKTLCNFAIGEIVFNLKYNRDVVESFVCTVGGEVVPAAAIADTDAGCAITLDGGAESIVISDIVVANHTKVTNYTDDQAKTITFTNLEATDAEIETETQYFSVIIAGVPQEFPTLAAAITAANGATISLIQDYTIADNVTIGADAVIDLAGNDIVFTDEQGEGLGFDILANLTIIDSVGGGKVADEAVAQMANALYVDGGILTIGAADDQGPTIDCVIDYQGDPEYANTVDIIHGSINKAFNLALSGDGWNMVDEDSEIASQDGNYFYVAPKAAPVVKPFAIIIAGDPVVTNEYDTLDAAIAEATDGDTITMIADADISTTGATFPAGTEITLDLNGKSLKVGEQQTTNIKVLGKLTLVDSVENSTGKIYTEDAWTGNAYGYGVIRVGAPGGIGAEFVMNSGKIEAVINNPAANGQFAIVVLGNDTEVTLNGGEVTAGWYAVSGNGTAGVVGADALVTVAGTRLVSTADYAIYWPNLGKVVVSDGIVDGAAGAICANNGEVEISGGALASQGTGNTGSWSDGTGGLGNAVVYINAKYADTKLTITGGDFTANASALSITNGDGHQAIVAVSGGTYNKSFDAKYLAEGYTLAYDETTGKYSVAQSKPVIPYSLACLGVTADDTTGTITFTVNTGYTLTSVYLNGEAQELPSDVGGVYSMAKPANGALVIYAKKDREVATHKWYESPRIVNQWLTSTEFPGKGGDNVGLFHSVLGNDYFAAAPGYTGQAGGVFTFDSLLAGGDHTPLYVLNSDGSKSACTFRGSASCEKLNVALFGTYSGAKMISAPLNEAVTWDDLGTKVFEISNDKGYSIESFFFSEDGQYLYSSVNDPSSARPLIVRWVVKNGLKSTDVNLVWDAEWNVGTRVRCMTGAKIGDNTIVYALLDGTSGIKAVNTADGSITTILASTERSCTYCGLTVSGAKSSTPHLLLYEQEGSSAGYANIGPFYIWELTSAGTALASDTPVVKWELDDLKEIGIAYNSSYGNCVAVSEDEGTAIVAVADRNVYTVVYCPKYEVVFANGDEAITNKVWEGDTTTAPADPEKAGYIFKGWFDGDTEFNPATPVMANATYTAKFEKDAQPLDPEEPTPSKDPAADAAKMNENGSVKPEFINVPTGAVAANYAALFVAVPGDGVVTIELNEDGTNTLQQSANAVEAQVAAQLANISTLSEITVAPAAKDIVPGFYYGLAATADVTTMKTADPAQWKQATTAGIDGGLTADKPSTAKGFFQIKVSVKAPVTEPPVE